MPLLEEKIPLVSHYGQVVQYTEGGLQIRPLRYSEIVRATNGCYDALSILSEARYFAQADIAWLHELREKLMIAVMIFGAVRGSRVLAIDRGDATLQYSLPGEARAGGKMFELLGRITRITQPAEVKRRKREWLSAFMELYNEVIGDKGKDMFELVGLATAPKKQGRGYATALVNVLNQMADAEGKAIWLATTDSAGFYETVGFKLAGERWIARDTPGWHGGPVPVRIMIREGRS